MDLWPKFTYHENCAGHKHPFEWPKKIGIADTIPKRLIHSIRSHKCANNAIVNDIVHQEKGIKNG